jgi:hypothetical protein
VAVIGQNGKVPRGPIVGCHVAPLYWLLVYWFVNQNFMGPWGSNPRTSPFGNALVECGLPLAHTVVLINHVPFNIFKFKCICGLGPRPGQGLAPALGHALFHM